MNKKILSLILCLILALSVVFAVSCGGNDPVDTNSDTSTDTGSENTDTNEPGNSDVEPGDTDTDTEEPEAPAEKITITFVYGNGADNLTVEIDKGGKVTVTIAAPAAPEGYVFAGWVLADGTVWTSNTVFDADATVTANFTGNQNIIQFDPNGTGVRGDMSLGQTMATGEKGNLIPNAYTRTGYIFKGWATSANGSVVYENEAEFEMGTEILTKLYAVWQVVEYGISYELDGGVNDPANPDKYTVENIVTFKPATKEGYEFLRWEFFGNPTETTEDLTGGVILTAVFARAKHQVTYVGATFDEHTNPAVVTVDDVIALKDASKVGYTFEGWYKDEGFTTAITTLENIDAPISIYAKFVKIVYNITYKIDENMNAAEGNPATYDFESTIVFKAPTYKSVGYEFDGWYIEGTDTKLEGITAGEFAQNLVLEAKFKIRTFTVTYNGADNLMPEDTVTSYTINDTTLTEIVLPALTKAGYEFGGWYSDDKFENKIEKLTVNLANPSDLVAYAKFTVIEYTITYNFGSVEGASTSSATKYTVEKPVEFGSVTPIDGYTFEGWYTDAEYTNAVTSTAGLTGNITIYGKYVDKNSLPTFIVGWSDVQSHEVSETNARKDYVEKLFDGDSYYEGIYGGGNSWYGNQGDKITIVFKNELEITSFKVKVGGNWTFSQYTLYDAEGNTVGGGSALGNRSDGGTGDLCTIFEPSEGKESVKVKSITIEITSIKWGDGRTHKVCELEIVAKNPNYVDPNAQ